jgi:hypothetical protein
MSDDTINTIWFTLMILLLIVSLLEAGILITARRVGR